MVVVYFAFHFEYDVLDAVHVFYYLVGYHWVVLGTDLLGLGQSAVGFPQRFVGHYCQIYFVHLVLEELR